MTVVSLLMNLLDCSIPYFLTVPAVLDLRPKALQTVLELHSGYRNDVSARMQHELGLLASKVKAHSKSFMLPTSLDFSKLSHAATKTLIACYWKSKRSRTAYRITLTREQLAEHAQLSVRHLRSALIELQKKRLVDVKAAMAEGNTGQPAQPGIRIRYGALSHRRVRSHETEHGPGI